MKEREQEQEERLQALFTAADPPLMPSETFRQRVADVTAREREQAARRKALWPFGRRAAMLPGPWIFGVRAAGAALAVLLVAALILGRAGRDRQGDSRPAPPRMATTDAGIRPEIPPRRPREKAHQAPAPAPGRAPAGAPDANATHAAPTHGVPPAPRGPKQAPSPTAQPEADPAYLDGRDASLLAYWTGHDAKDEAASAWLKRRLPPIKDDFVHVPPPRIAAADLAGLRAVEVGTGRPQAKLAPPQLSQLALAAIRAYEQEAKVVDARLFRKVTLQLKGAPLEELCEDLARQTGAQLRAARPVADEKVTVFVKDQPARDVMRSVARLLGHFWLRAGKEGAYRYEISQDLRSQLMEEEVRSRDYHAALAALDDEMAGYRPYLDLTPVQLKARQEKPRSPESERLFTLLHDGWGAAQLYHRLSAADRQALASGKSLVFRADATDPERRLPAEWARTQAQLWKDVRQGDKELSVDQIRLTFLRRELAEVTLRADVSVSWPGEYGPSRSGTFPDIATGRSPSVARPKNAETNQTLRGESPFDQVVSLRPEASCPWVKGAKRPDGEYFWSHIAQAPHVSSADVWEALHRETGRSIVADFYSGIYPLAKLSIERASLFDALCRVGDEMGVRWKKDGEFLLCRSTSYFWRKLQEVPRRQLENWQRIKRQEGHLPLECLMEMAALSDDQLSSPTVGEAIRHCWGLEEWTNVGAAPRHEYYSSSDHLRFLATLTPEQRHRASWRQGALPLREFSPGQQQAYLELRRSIARAIERQGGQMEPLTSEQLAFGRFGFEYVPAGWYVWTPPASAPDRPLPEGLERITARTAAEALAEARRSYPEAEPSQVSRFVSGWFGTGLRMSYRDGKPVP